MLYMYTQKMNTELSSSKCKEICIQLKVPSDHNSIILRLGVSATMSLRRLPTNTTLMVFHMIVFSILRISAGLWVQCIPMIFSTLIVMQSHLLLSTLDKYFSLAGLSLSGRGRCSEVRCSVACSSKV